MHSQEVRGVALVCLLLFDLFPRVCACVLSRLFFAILPRYVPSACSGLNTKRGLNFVNMAKLWNKFIGKILLGKFVLLLRPQFRSN